MSLTLIQQVPGLSGPTSSWSFKFPDDTVAQSIVFHEEQASSIEVRWNGAPVDLTRSGPSTWTLSADALAALVEDHLGSRITIDPWKDLDIRVLGSMSSSLQILRPSESASQQGYCPVATWKNRLKESKSPFAGDTPAEFPSKSLRFARRVFFDLECLRMLVDHQECGALGAPCHGIAREHFVHACGGKEEDFDLVTTAPGQVQGDLYLGLVQGIPSSVKAWKSNTRNHDIHLGYPGLRAANSYSSLFSAILARRCGDSVKKAAKAVLYFGSGLARMPIAPTTRKGLVNEDLTIYESRFNAEPDGAAFYCLVQLAFHARHTQPQSFLSKVLPALVIAAHLANRSYGMINFNGYGETSMTWKNLQWRLDHHRDPRPTANEMKAYLRRALHVDGVTGWDDPRRDSPYLELLWGATLWATGIHGYNDGCRLPR